MVLILKQDRATEGHSLAENSFAHLARRGMGPDLVLVWFSSSLGSEVGEVKKKETGETTGDLSMIVTCLTTTTHAQRVHHSKTGSC